MDLCLDCLEARAYLCISGCSGLECLFLNVVGTGGVLFLFFFFLVISPVLVKNILVFANIFTN